MTSRSAFIVVLMVAVFVSSAVAEADDSKVKYGSCIKDSPDYRGECNSACLLGGYKGGACGSPGNVDCWCETTTGWIGG